MNYNTPITVYVLNLIEREDRYLSTKKQFANRLEFNLSIVPAIKHKIGAYGQWKSFIKIVMQEIKKNSDFFIFCEDDHVFTKKYNFDYLSESVKRADKLGADLLCGGVGFIKDAVQCTEHLFWVKTFNGLQFTVIFNRFYEKIIKSDVGDGFVADFYLSTISDNIFIMYPFISRQREFGYSDITEKNNQEGYVNKVFCNTEKSLDILNKVKLFYQNISHDIR